MKLLFITIIFLTLMYSCEEIIEPEKGKAEIILSGELYPSELNNLKGYQGSVINKGLETGFNCLVNITCIDTSNADSVLGSLTVNPAEGGNIAPAERVGFYTYFDSTASSVFDFNLADSFMVTIKFETR